MNAAQLRTHLAAVTRDRLGRFVTLTALRECSDTDCRDATTWTDAIEQHDAFLEVLETMLQTTDPAQVRDLTEVVRAYRIDLRKDVEAVGDDRLVQPLKVKDFVRGQGVGEVMDVTGVDARTAQVLALKLANWRPDRQRGPVYKRRDGKRYIRTGPWRVDLNDPIMTPWRDDITAAMADRRSRHEIVRDNAADDRPAFDATYAALEQYPPLPPLVRRPST